MVEPMRTIMTAFWALVAVACLVFQVGCGSAQHAPTAAAEKPAPLTIDEECHLTLVRGDVSGAANPSGWVFLVADGLGVLRSRDGGETFEHVTGPRSMRWPSVAVHGSRTWVSWVHKGATSTAVIAALGGSLGLEVAVVDSSRPLIDTELVALGGGHLLLFVTEVEGPVNTNDAVYTIYCHTSINNGLTWAPGSVVVEGPRGVNLEDARAVVLRGRKVLLAFEWEEAEGGASQIMTVETKDEGATWSQPSLLWGGEPADREPGGFGWRGSELWFVASTDEGAVGRSYAGAKISLIRSQNGGRSWSPPTVLIDEPSQLSMGVVVLDHAVLLPSVRSYERRRSRSLALYQVDPIGRWRLGCGGAAGQ